MRRAALLVAVSALVLASGAAAATSPSSDLLDTLEGEVQEATGSDTQVEMTDDPYIALEQPSDGATVCSPTRIVGSASGQDLVRTATVEVQDASGATVFGPEAVSLDVYDRFSLDADLSPGDHVAVAAIANEQGGAASTSTDFTVKDPLTLSVDRPSDGATLRSIDELSGRVRSCAGDVDVVDVTVRDAAGTVVAEPEVSVDSTWNRWSASLATELPVGDYDGLVRATDDLGHEAVQRVGWTIDRSVDLRVDDPEAGATVTHLDEVRGSVQGTSVATVAAEVVRDGSVVAESTGGVDPDFGTWSVMIGDHLDSGDYEIRVDALASDGRVLAEEALPVTVETSATLAVERPASGDVLDTLSQVSGRAVTDVGSIDTVTMSVETAEGATVLSDRTLDVVSGRFSEPVSTELDPGDYRVRVTTLVDGVTLSDTVPFTIGATRFLDDTWDLTGDLTDCAEDEVLSETGECVPLEDAFRSLSGSDLCQATGDAAGTSCMDTTYSTTVQAVQPVGCSTADVRVGPPDHAQGGPFRADLTDRGPPALDAVAGRVAEPSGTQICLDEVDAFEDAIERELQGMVPDGHTVQRVKVDFVQDSGQLAATSGGFFEVESHEEVRMFHFAAEQGGWHRLSKLTGDRRPASAADDAVVFETPGFSPFAVSYSDGSSEDNETTPDQDPSEDDGSEDGTDGESGEDGTGDGTDGTGDDAGDDASTAGDGVFDGGDPLGEMARGEMPWFIYAGVLAASIALGGGATWWVRRPDAADEMPETPLDAFDDDPPEER